MVEENERVEFRVIGVKDSKEWDQYISLLENQVFWINGYSALYSHQGSINLAIYESMQGFVVYPFIQRNLSFLVEDEGLSDYYDITSPYGYGGPLWRLNTDKDVGMLLRSFYASFEKHCKNNKIISEFVRLHPLVHSRDLFDQFIDMEEKNLNIYVPLGQLGNEEEILSGYKHNNRKSIRKARDSQVKVIIDKEGKYFRDFYNIYLSTMLRNGASSFYYFPEEYFQQIHSKMKGRFIYFHSLYENKVVSTELLLYDQNCIYSFLGGTLSEFFHVCPNNLLKHEIILWAKQQGIENYILGGGYEPNDGIFNYKKSFAPNHVMSFYIGKKIFDQEIYNEITKLRMKKNGKLIPGYFPSYRG